MNWLLAASFFLVGGISVGAPCDPYVIERPDGSYGDDSTVIATALSKAPLQTKYVSSVAYYSRYPGSAAYVLSCNQDFSQKAVLQKMRSALHWVNLAAIEMKNYFSQLGLAVEPVPLRISLIGNYSDQKLGEEYAISATELFGRSDDTPDEMQLAISDLEGSDISPTLVVHEFIHIIHTTYLDKYFPGGKHRSRQFAEALADFFSAIITNSHEMREAVKDGPASYVIERDFNLFNTYPRDIVTTYEYLKPLGKYWLAHYGTDRFPKKHAQVEQKMEFAEKYLNDPSDMRNWYYYINGLIINQSLWRVISAHPEWKPNISRAYLSAIARVPNEDWDALSQMSKEDANRALTSAFYNPVNFALGLVSGAEPLELKAAMSAEFKKAIRGIK